MKVSMEVWLMRQRKLAQAYDLQMLGSRVRLVSLSEAEVRKLLRPTGGTPE